MANTICTMYNVINLLSVFCVGSSIAFMVLMTVTLIRERPKIKIMRITWIMTILWSSYGGLWLYKKFAHKGVDGAEYSSIYSWPHIVLATIQTGAACMISILSISILAHFVPIRFEGNLEVGISIFEWITALIISIIMQYGNLKQRGVHSPIKALDRAFRSEIFSVTAWLSGFFLWIGFTRDTLYGDDLIVKTHWTYWFMEQIGMYIGLFVAIPINYLLIKKGIKKNM